MMITTAEVKRRELFHVIYFGVLAILLVGAFVGVNLGQSISFM